MLKSIIDKANIETVNKEEEVIFVNCKKVSKDKSKLFNNAIQLVLTVMFIYGASIIGKIIFKPALLIIAGLFILKKISELKRRFK